MKTIYQQALEKITAAGGDFSIEETRVNGIPMRVFKRSSLSLRWLYEHSRAQFKDQPFLVYEDQRWTFEETFQNVATCAQMLVRHYRIQKGERVVIAMRNYPEWIVCYMALTSIGAIVVPMNAWWTTSELHYGLQDCGASLAIVDEERLARLRPLLSNMDLKIIAVRCPDSAIQGMGEGLQHYDPLMATEDAKELPPVEIDPEEEASIMYTSGSTGHPKGAVSSHRGILSSLLSWQVDRMAKMVEQGIDLANPPEPDFPPTTLITTPLFHVTGSHALFLLAWFSGSKAVLMHKWEAHHALELIEQEKVTNFSGVPTMSWELLRASKERDCDLSSLVGVGAGGAARPPQHVRLIEEKIPGTASMGWGLTETNALGATNSGAEYLKRPASTGRPHPLIEMKILGKNDEEMPLGQAGEIVMKSPSNVRGYWNKPEATAAAFQQGWFRTGDIGCLDEDGFLYIVDRAKDIVIRGGENISCLEVEAALYEHPAVLEAAVFGVPEERLGEVVYAVLRIKSGGQVKAEALQTFLTGRIAHFKIPEHYQFRTSPLPRGGTEKINKRLLRKEVMAWWGSS